MNIYRKNFIQLLKNFSQEKSVEKSEYEQIKQEIKILEYEGNKLQEKIWKLKEKKLAISVKEIFNCTSFCKSTCYLYFTNYSNELKYGLKINDRATKEELAKLYATGWHCSVDNFIFGSVLRFDDNDVTIYFSNLQILKKIKERFDLKIEFNNTNLEPKNIINNLFDILLILEFLNNKEKIEEARKLIHELSRRFKF